MCTYLYPNADDEGIFLATGFMTVQFVNDDIFDSAAILKAIQATPSGQRLARDLQKLCDTPQRLADGIVCTARIMENPHAYEECCEIISDLETDPYLLGATHELSARMHLRGRRIDEKRFEVWLAKSCASMKDFGKSHALIYSEAKDMTVEEYAGHKLRNSGMVYTVLFVEMAMGTFLSEEHNAIPRIPVLVSTEKIGLYEAAQRVTAMSQRHAQEVKRIWIEIESECDDDSEEDTVPGTYVADMELFGAACWSWQLQGTKRYFSKTSPFVELRLAGVSLEAEAEKA
ncbi:hypothetical protein DER44DRAFT_741802 [Fusarium oxysporum]|nr:hypothetical protein DER44DRAFT_741802 [Fusarium oxysporum]